MEVELKKLEDLSESIVNDFAYMRAREEEMRTTNGKAILDISISLPETIAVVDCELVFWSFAGCFRGCISSQFKFNKHDLH